MIYVYTDGSHNGGEHYSGAYIVYDGTRRIHENAGIGVTANSMRNVAGELSAVMRAVRWLVNNRKKGCIVFDYIGIEKWITGEWRAKNEYTKAYAKFVKPYYDNGTISFKWTKAHAGDLGNEFVDKLAQRALRNKEKWKPEN